MAQVTSNIIPPAQQALNSKLFTPQNPINFGTSGTTAATLPSQTKPAPVTFPGANLPKSNIGAAISGASNAVGGLIGGLYNYASAPAGTSYQNANTPALPPTAPGSSTGLGALASYSPQTTGAVSSNSTGTGGGLVTGLTPGFTYTPQQAAADGQPQTPTSPQTPQTPTPPPTTPPAQTPAAPLTYPGLVGSLVNTAQGNQTIGQQANQIAQNYGQQIAQVGNLGTGTQEGDLSTGTNVVGEGNANLASQAESNRISVLSAAENAALAGTGQQLTAQQQAQAGLGAAVNSTQPQLGTVGTQTFYTPLTGQTTSGGTNTPATGGIAQGEAALGATLPAMSAGIQAAQQVQGDINTLITTKGLNPSASNALNSVNQWVAGQQLSDPSYNELIGDLNDYAGKIAPIIGAMGVQTDAKTFIAQQMLNGSAQGQTIMDVLNNLNTLLGQSYTAAQKGAYGGQPAGANGSSPNSVTSSVFPGTTYQLVNGQWTASQT